MRRTPGLFEVLRAGHDRPSLLDAGNPHAVANLGMSKALERVARRMGVEPRMREGEVARSVIVFD